MATFLQNRGPNPYCLRRTASAVQHWVNLHLLALDASGSRASALERHRVNWLAGWAGQLVERMSCLFEWRWLGFHQQGSASSGFQVVVYTL